MSCHCNLFLSRLVWFLVRTLISWSLLWNQRLRLFTAESSVSTKWLIWTTEGPWTVTAQLRILGWEWPRVSHPYYICTTSFCCEDKPNHTRIVPVMLEFVTVRKCLLSVILSVCFDGINLWLVISSSSKGQIGCSTLLGWSWCWVFHFFESEKEKGNLANIFYHVWQSSEL